MPKRRADRTIAPLYPTQIMVHQERIHLSTNCYGHMHDITDKVNAIVKKSGIKTGMAYIFNIGSMASIGTIEFGPGLQRDLPEILNKLIPPSEELSRGVVFRSAHATSCFLSKPPQLSVNKISKG